MARLVFFAILALGTAIPAPAAAASSLPVAEGIWVETNVACSAAKAVRVHHGGRIGEFYMYGDGGSLGPAGGMHDIESVKPAKNGYHWVAYDGYDSSDQGLGMQVKSLPGGKAVFRMLGRLGPMKNPGPIEEAWSYTERLCPLEQLPPRLRAIVAPEVGAGATAALPANPAPLLPQRWEVEPAAGINPAIAYVDGPPAVPAVLLGCKGAVPQLMMTFAQGRPTTNATVKFTFPLGANVSANMTWGEKNQLWTGPAPSALIGLLAGSDTSAEISIDNNAAGTLSLNGSTKAIYEALAPCIINVAPTPTGGVVGQLAIKAGHYVSEGVACGDPVELFYYDGKRAGYRVSGFASSADIGPLGKISKMKDEWFLEDHEMSVKVLGPDRILLTVQDTGPPMRLCEATQIPRDMRGDL